MKKLFYSLLLCVGFIPQLNAQGPGLVISEVLANPAGTDSPFEYVELVATRTIDFSVTPYSVVFTNNGTATAQGWTAGLGITYGFDITSGTVNLGDVVYVGGSSMSPTGTKLRVINTGTTNGDGFGNFNTSGVLGNGGTNCDAVAVFSTSTAFLTSTTVPDDALFFGTGTGTAVVSSGNDGYQLPYNDLYAGGKLQTTSFLAADPTSGNALIATGVFNQVTGAFTTTRSFALGAGTDMATGISFSTAAGNVTAAIASTNQTITETTPTATFNVTITNANSAQAIFRVNSSAQSTASLNIDYSLNNIIVVPAGSTTTQTVTVSMLDDALVESDEYVIFSLSGLTNASVTGGNLHALYIKDEDYNTPVATNQLVLNLLGSYSNGAAGTNSAEIVAHDPSVQRLYIANSVGAKLDIIDFANPSTPTLITSISVNPAYGNINSVAVHNGIVAAAIENSTNPQDSGKVVFFDAMGTFINSVKVGAMPDMLTFNHAGTSVVVACEGEPNSTYTNDPEGRVCVIDISGGVAALTQSQVSFINFTSYIGQETLLRSQGIRIFGPGANAAQDFEPEYVTISDDDQTAWVTLQENNALLTINLTTNTITEIKSLGTKDHNLFGNGLDASDQTAGINLSNFPVKGMYLPDAITNITIGGQTYLLTANEGDTRDYPSASFTEEGRISTLSLDPTAFPAASQLKSNVVAGRLLASNKMGDIDSDGDIDEIYTIGTRSFSIWDATSGTLVYDSGDDFERITSTHPTYAAMFNASNGSSIAVKNRSDDKGPEPEGVTTAVIDGNTYAFASLERIGGVMVYNINNPSNPIFVGYYNNRSVATNGPDRGAEGMIFIHPSNSPNGNGILILANEISSTLTIYEVNSCKSLSGVELMLSNGDSLCSGDTTHLFTAPQAGVTYQWLANGMPVSGATDSVFTANTSGYYTLTYVNSVSMCGDSIGTSVVVNPLPAVMANASATTVCSNDSLTLNGTGASSYLWNNGVTDMVPFLLGSSNSFIVTGTDDNGCSNADTIAITVNAAPVVGSTATETVLCSGETTTLTGTGATSYIWSGGVTNGVAFSPLATTDFIVTGTDVAGCSNTDTITITVIDLDVNAIATFATVCQGGSTALNGTGATSYTWSDGVVNGIGFVPAGSQYYIVTGTDVNGCIDVDSILITVIPAPNPTISYAGGILSIPTYTTMQWYLNGNPIPGATSSTYTPSADGVYTVEVTNPSGCTGTSIGLNLNWSAIAQNLTKTEFNVYPNPVNQTLIVDVSSIDFAQVVLTNMLGENLLAANGTGKILLDVAHLTNGMYLIHIQTRTGHQVTPVLKN